MPREGTTATVPPDAITPELALVDERLAELVRAGLPQSDDTLARIELLVRAHRVVVARAPSDTAEPAAPPPPVELQVDDSPQSAAARRRLGRGRMGLVAGTAAAAALALAFLGGVRVDLSGNPAGANTSSIGEPPTAPSPREPTSRPPTPSRARPAASPGPRAARPKQQASVTSEPRKFVWAPVTGASGYHVEFFRGSSLVFSADTVRPEVSVPARWTFAAKTRSLVPGDYQWYVWPVRGGIRGSHAEVQAKLHVPAS